MTHITSIPGSALQGTIRIPGDKSITHRALILGALAKDHNQVILHNWLQSLDCLATLQALQELGVTCKQKEDALIIDSVGLYGLQAPRKVLDVGNSGTSIRLLTGVLAAQKFSSTITGDASLCKRPMQRIITPLRQMGAAITAVDDNFAPLQISGGRQLKPIEYAMPIASAQVKSAILLADLYTNGKSIIHSPNVCRDHTEILLDNFAYSIDIPGDISSAAFFMVGATITPNSDVLLQNIGVNPTRTAVIQILQLMGANIEISNMRKINGELRADLHIKTAKQLRAITIPEKFIANAIDELPIICLAAACAQGTTIIRGARELRYKESDRIKMLAQGFTSLGVKTSVFADGLAISGGIISGGEVASGGDHRIAMTFVFAGLVAQQAVIVQDTQNIATSFPGFVQTAQQSGMLIEEESAYA